MDRGNLRHLQGARPAGGRAHLAPFTGFAPQGDTDEVSDLKYTLDFDATLTLIEICAKGLWDQL